jgi:hypothetical protein
MNGLSNGNLSGRRPSETEADPFLLVIAASTALLFVALALAFLR